MKRLFKITTQFPERRSNEKWKLFFKALLSILLIKFSFSLILYLNYFLGNSDLLEFFSDQTDLTSVYSENSILILTILVMPIVEEISFRGILTKSKWVLTFSVPMAFLFLIFFLFDGVGIVSSLGLYFFLMLLILLLSAYITFRIASFFLTYISDNFRVFNITSILLFTSAHAFNFDLTDLTLVDSLNITIVLAPYFFTAIVLSNIRIQNGLAWSVGLHILSNSIVLVTLVNN